MKVKNDLELGYVGSSLGYQLKRGETRIPSVLGALIAGFFTSVVFGVSLRGLNTNSLIFAAVLAYIITTYLKYSRRTRGV